MAEFHFRQAVEINPQSSILNCYIGMVGQSWQSSLSLFLICLLDLACVREI